MSVIQYMSVISQIHHCELNWSLDYRDSDVSSLGGRHCVQNDTAVYNVTDVLLKWKLALILWYSTGVTVSLYGLATCPRMRKEPRSLITTPYYFDYIFCRLSGKCEDVFTCFMVFVKHRWVIKLGYLHFAAIITNIIPECMPGERHNDPEAVCGGRTFIEGIKIKLFCVYIWTRSLLCVTCWIL